MYLFIHHKIHEIYLLKNHVSFLGKAMLIFLLYHPVIRKNVKFASIHLPLQFRIKPYEYLDQDHF